MQGRLHSLLDTLFELQSLDRVDRSGYALRGVPEPESVAEHTFHLVFLVWALADEEPGLDRPRVMELALLHDVAEVRIGDLPRPVKRYLPPGAKASAERAAAAELLAPLGSRGTDLWAEYDAKETPEARFVAVCDKLQLLLKARVYESWGFAGVRAMREKLEDLDDEGFASVRGLLEELRERGG